MFFKRNGSTGSIAGAALAVVCLLAGTAAAQGVIYVDRNSAGATENGTQANPFKTIAAAAASTQLQSNTMVIVRGGQGDDEVVYEENDIRPRVSGTAGGMIVFKPATYENPEGRTVYENVVIKHSGRRSDGGMITTDAQYSSAAPSQTTDLFNLRGRDYIWIEGFNFKDYKYSRVTIIINGMGNVVVNNRFENLGCEPNGGAFWGDGLTAGDVIVSITGNQNVVRNNYFRNNYGEMLSYNSGQDNVIIENTIIGVKQKQESTASTLGGRFEGNRHNLFAFNYNGGTVSGRTIWLDVCVGDFTALRNIAHNTYCFIFNESGCERNLIYENIAYNKPVAQIDGKWRMQPTDPNTDFSAQSISGAYYPAFHATGSTWDARWINNVAYNVRDGIILERSWRDEVRNNITYEDEQNQWPNHPNPDIHWWEKGDPLGILVKEVSVIGYHRDHGYNLRGGGPQVIRNNLWYSTRKANFVRYMEPTQAATTVAELNAQINANDLAVSPGFLKIDVNSGEYDFRLSPGSPARGTGDNGVNRGAYAIYEPIDDYDIIDRGSGLYDVGYTNSLGPISDVNVSFAQLNSPGPLTNYLNGRPYCEDGISRDGRPCAGSGEHYDPHRPFLKAGDMVDIELILSGPASEAMSFKVVPVAGDAWMQGHRETKFPDFRFPKGQTVTFGTGERTKTVRVEILRGNPQHKRDQLLALRIQPVSGSTSWEDIGGRNLHLIKIRRVDKYSVTTINADGVIGRSVTRDYIPNGPGFPPPPDGHHPFAVNATRAGFQFASWATGAHEIKNRLADRMSANTTLLDDDLQRHVTIEANWVGDEDTDEGRPSYTAGRSLPAVTGITIPNRLTFTADDPPYALSPITIQPSGRNVHDVIWTSTNPRVATVSVSDDGVVTVTAVSSGTAAIRAKAVRNHDRVAICSVTVAGTKTTPTPEMRTEGGYYTIRSVNNGRYMEAVDANVAIGGFSPETKWLLEQASDNYYRIHTVEGDETPARYVFVANDENDANAGLAERNAASNNQQFKFVQISGDTASGMYLIRTRITDDARVVDAAADGNILQWESNGGLNQYWMVEFHPDPKPESAFGFALLTPDSDSYFGTDETNIAAVNGQETRSLNIVDHPYAVNIFGTWGWHDDGYAWGGNSDYKRAFDGNILGTFFDGPGRGHVGVELKEPYAVSRVVYRPRANFADRLNGAVLQGSLDGADYENILTLSVSNMETYTKIWDGIPTGGWTANAGKEYKFYRLMADGDALLNIGILELYALVEGGGSVTSVLETDRTVTVVPNEDAAVVAPVNTLSAEFTAGPNPGSRSSGAVRFYRLGARVNNASLTIYDASGNAVRRINIRDDGATSDTRRVVGEWDLRDNRGRTVAEGTYLVRGTIRSTDGRRERVSVIIGVR